MSGAIYYVSLQFAQFCMLECSRHCYYCMLEFGDGSTRWAAMRWRFKFVKSMVQIEYSAPFLGYECMYLTFTVQVSTCRLEMQARNWLRGDASTPLIYAVGQ